MIASRQPQPPASNDNGVFAPARTAASTDILGVAALLVGPICLRFISDGAFLIEPNSAASRSAA